MKGVEVGDQERRKEIRKKNCLVVFFYGRVSNCNHTSQLTCPALQTDVHRRWVLNPHRLIISPWWQELLHHCFPRKEGATKKGGRENLTAKKALTQKNAFYLAYLRVSHGRIVLPFCHAQVVLPSLHRSILRAWRPRLLSLSCWRVLNVIPQKLPSYLSCNICVFSPVCWIPAWASGTRLYLKRHPLWKWCQTVKGVSYNLLWKSFQGSNQAWDKPEVNRTLLSLTDFKILSKYVWKRV